MGWGWGDGWVPISATAELVHRTYFCSSPLLRTERRMGVYFWHLMKLCLGPGFKIREDKPVPTGTELENIESKRGKHFKLTIE